MREYLESVDAGSNPLTQWFFSKWLTQMPARDKARRRALEAQGLDEAAVEAEIAKLKQAPDPDAELEGKNAAEKFLSGDNPIVVVMSILGVFIAVQVALHPR